MAGCRSVLKVLPFPGVVETRSTKQPSKALGWGECHLH